MNRVGSTPWMLCFLLFLATGLSFLDRQVLSVLAPSIMSELGCNAPQSLASAFSR